jgi:hypothetical protein
MPQSGDVLFTIRIYIDALAALKHRAGGPAVAASLAEQLRAMTGEQLSYKGLRLEREDLLARLGEIAG